MQCEPPILEAFRRSADQCRCFRRVRQDGQLSKLYALTEAQTGDGLGRDDAIRLVGTQSST